MADREDNRTSNTLPKRQKAVALQQNVSSADRPHITAVGHGHQAEKILQLAFDNNIKVREDEDLVNILANFNEGSLIPVEAIMAVSEILYYVYQANQHGPQPIKPPTE
ncbi:MAG: flagellar protein FhlB [Kordiimonas sp.]|nr:flagellar protein FhlB [Kordiimonas sp.]